MKYDVLYENLSKLIGKDADKKEFNAYMESFRSETVDTLCLKQTLTDNKITTIENKMTNLSLSSLIANDVKNVAESVKNLCSAVKEKVNNFFEHLKNNVTKTCSEVKTFALDNLAALDKKENEIIDKVDKVASDTINKVNDKATATVDKVKDSILLAKDSIKEKIDLAKTEVSQMVTDYKTNQAMEQLAVMDFYQARLTKERQTFIDQCTKKGLNVTKNQKEIDLIDVSNNQVYEDFHSKLDELKKAGHSIDFERYNDTLEMVIDSKNTINVPDTKIGWKNATSQIDNFLHNNPNIDIEIDK